MKKWTVRRSDHGNWLVKDPEGWLREIYPSHMWPQAFACAWELAVFEGIGIVGIEVTA